jgi:hypothetical protein
MAAHYLSSRKGNKNFSVGTFEIICMAWKTSHSAHFKIERKNELEIISLCFKNDI